MKQNLCIIRHKFTKKSTLKVHSSSSIFNELTLEYNHCERQVSWVGVRGRKKCYFFFLIGSKF